MLDKIMEMKHSPFTLKVNYKLIPCTQIPITEDGARIFNEIYMWLKGQCGWSTIVRTKSGGISIAVKNFYPPMWDVSISNYGIELTIVAAEGCWRIQFRRAAATDDKKHLWGNQAFKIFKEECKKQGINLDEMSIDNGEEVKKTIEKPYIKVAAVGFSGETEWEAPIFRNAHHIDFHNSYPAGLVNTHPEFRPVVEKFYNGRKEHSEYKEVLNLTIGYMQSMKATKARWAHLSRDAIADNNRRIEDLAARLEKSGRVVLLYNTDGIWYCGDVYHGDGEGSALGQWENDHVNCKLRIKSAGAYEFIEDGKYHPVVRGSTRLDKVKPRSEWSWGDIYNKEANLIMFVWTEDEGIVMKHQEGDLLL